MANEVEGQVSEVEAPQAGVGEEAPVGQEGAGVATPTIDPHEVEQLRQVADYWKRVEQGANTDPAFRKELERMWRGLPAQQQVQPTKPEPNQRREKNQEDDRLKTLQEKIEKFENYQQTQQQETLRKEKFAEVQSETESTFKKFNATDGDKTEFWNRYGNMIRNEAYGYIQNNPSLPPNRAMEMAYSRHSSNIAGEYALLMEDKLVDFYGRKLQDRNNPLRGIGTPADKAGKDGTWPTTQERFLSAIKNERNPEKRAEMYSAYAKEKGIPVGELFRSSGG